MASLETVLYASQRNGGSPSVSIADISALVGGDLQAADVTALTSVGPGVAVNTIVDVTATPTQLTVNANFATLATKVNAILAALKAAGLMA